MASVDNYFLNCCHLDSYISDSYSLVTFSLDSYSLGSYSLGSYWHERAAFQRLLFGRSRSGGRLLAMT